MNILVFPAVLNQTSNKNLGRTEHKLLGNLPWFKVATDPS